MTKFFKNIGAVMRKTWLWTLLLVLLVAAVVWFAGPLLAVDDYKFWEGAISRLLSISALFLMWGLAMVFVSWRAGIRRSAIEDSETGNDGIRRDAVIDKAEKELKTRFRRALKTLRSSGFYHGRSERWRDELPWYLLIGPTASGKTSMVESSGLEFPINEIDRKLNLSAESTQHCEWYFAENGVLIDTAGRYLTQPDPAVDGSAWRTLLGLLHKRRRHRPLNGVLVTLPVQALTNDAAMLETLADQVRARLQDIRQRLHVDLPVYLVVSKADHLPGFEQFFDQMSREESEQVLGVTFCAEQQGTDASVQRSEFEALLQRLSGQVITRMHQERDGQRRAAILGFPHQLAQLGEPLRRFIGRAFKGNRYQQLSQLRGFYLISAPYSDPTTTDADAVKAGAEGLRMLSGGRSRFIHHLLSRVIFPEAELAGLNQRERSRLRWRQRVLYVAALGTLAVVGTLWATGFAANSERLENLRDLAATWTRQRSAPTLPDDATAVLETLESSYAATEIFPGKDEVSYRERGGLYLGDSVTPVVNAAYQRELEIRLLPKVAGALEAQIRANMNDRERLLTSLRAYLMLGVQSRRDEAWLKEHIATEWSRRYAGSASIQNALNGHFERLLKQPFAYPLNEKLVAEARQVLRGESLASVVYRMLRDQARTLPEYRLSQHLGPQRALLVDADHVIPGFYTQQGYQHYFSLKGAALVTEILRDNWVLGDAAGISEMDLRHLMVQLEQLYFRDYATYWSEAVAQLAMPAFYDFGEGAEQLAGLTSANSPILQLLLEVRENTRFAMTSDLVDGAAQAAGELPGASGKLGKVASAAASKAADVSSTMALPDTAKKALMRRFDSLHRMLDDANGPSADLTVAFNALTDLQLQLASLARANTPEQAAFEMAKTRMAGQRDPLSHLRNAAARLPRPLNEWFVSLAEDTWRLALTDATRYVNQRYQAELYSFYSKAIQQRYPFNAHSASDVAINDFREFFKAQGIAERFFETYLRPFVSGDPDNYHLRSVDGQSLPITRAYLKHMASARVIRQSFFAENPGEPQVVFKLEPYTLDPAVGRAEFKFGDKSIEYRHGPIIPVSFKWPADAEGGRTSLVFDKMVGRPVGIDKNSGPWSLFRLFDLMQTEYLTGRDVLVLKAEVGGLRANYLLTSQRTPNPFDMDTLRTFQLPAQL